jgi:hypothetical protein
MPPASSFRACALALLAGALAAPASAQGERPPPAGPNRVDYRIEARVETARRRLVGSQTVSFENRTDHATSELWFHLYWNAFANNLSTHMVETGGKLRGTKVEDGWGWQRVLSVRAHGEELSGTLAFQQPDDGNADDRTVFKVDLPRPVGPGEKLDVEVEWEAQFPRLRRRTGYKGDFLFAAHWFPALGVFEGARGWNCHQFHENTEFYSDYGTYDVTLDLPQQYEKKVFATGVIAGSPTRAGNRVRTRFLAPDPVDRERFDAFRKRPLVHTFTWTADPDFKVFTKTFHFDRWAERHDRDVGIAQQALGKDVDLRLRNVEVRVLIQPEHEKQWERHYEATCAALFFYGLWFGEYPYSHVTVVDPAWGAAQAGGMEYPTLFTAGTRLWTTPRMHSPESVTVHECGHQFWYGLVGNNEFEAAWLDEGLNSYADSETLWRVYGSALSVTDYAHIPFHGSSPAPGPGTSGIDALLSARRIEVPMTGFSLTPLRPSGFVDWWRDQPLLTFVEEWTDPRWGDRIRYLGDPDRDPIDTRAWKFADRRSYTANSYAKTAVALRTLRGIVGEERFLRGMRGFAEDWRYRHPASQDFVESFCAGAESDVRWYFEEVFRGTATLDWSVSVEQAREEAPRGVFQANLEQEGPRAEFVDLPAAEAGAERPWVADVRVVRRGELRLPLELELRFDDGTSERRTWARDAQDGSKWFEIRVRGERKLVSVVLDPDRACYLDADLSDNAWHDRECEVAPWRWSERVFQRFLQLLHWQAGIGG